MKYKILLFAIILFPQLIYAQQPKMEITLRDIYEEMKTFKEIHQKDMLEIKQTLAKHDEHFKAIDQRFNAVDQRFEAVNQRFDSVNKRLDTHLQLFLFTIVIMAAILGFIFVKLSQIGERMSGLETLLTGDIKPAKQKVMEMAFLRTEEFKVMQDENRKLRKEMEKMQTALKKADILS